MSTDDGHSAFVASHSVQQALTWAFVPARTTPPEILDALKRLERRFQELESAEQEKLRTVWKAEERWSGWMAVAPSVP